MPFAARARSSLLLAPVALLAAAPAVAAADLTPRVAPVDARIGRLDPPPVGALDARRVADIDLPPVGDVDLPPVGPLGVPRVGDIDLPPVGPVDLPPVDEVDPPVDVPPVRDLDPPRVGEADGAAAAGPRAESPAGSRPGATAEAVAAPGRGPRARSGAEGRLTTTRARRRSRSLASAADRRAHARRPALPAGAPQRSGRGAAPEVPDTLVDDVLGAIRPAAAKAGFPLLLLLAGAAFLLVHHRIDRRDPKLARSPLAADPGLPFGPPPEA